MIDQKTIWAHFHEFEDSFPYMYLDVYNYVTVGIGHLLAKPEDAEALPFIYRKDHRDMKDGQSIVTASKGKVATRKEIAAEYAHVSSKLFTNQNLKAEAFDGPTYLGLTDDAIASLFAKDVSSKIQTLKRILPEVDLYPPVAQLVLLDLIYNGYLVKGEPLFNAAKARDWEKAAKLCPVTPDKGRDAYRIASFRSATATEKQKKAMDSETPKGRPRNISSPLQCTIPGDFATPLTRQRSVPPR